MPIVLKALDGIAPSRRYHDGYLTIHFEANKYQDIELSPLQEEALWCAHPLPRGPSLAAEALAPLLLGAMCCAG